MGYFSRYKPADVQPGDLSFVNWTSELGSKQDITTLGLFEGPSRHASFAGRSQKAQIIAQEYLADVKAAVTGAQRQEGGRQFDVSQVLEQQKQDFTEVQQKLLFEAQQKEQGRQFGLKETLGLGKLDLKKQEFGLKAGEQKQQFASIADALKRSQELQQRFLPQIEQQGGSFDPSSGRVSLSPPPKALAFKSPTFTAGGFTGSPADPTFRQSQTDRFNSLLKSGRFDEDQAAGVQAQLRGLEAFAPQPPLINASAEARQVAAQIKAAQAAGDQGLVEKLSPRLFALIEQQRQAQTLAPQQTLAPALPALAPQQTRAPAQSAGSRLQSLISQGAGTVPGATTAPTPTLAPAQTTAGRLQGLIPQAAAAESGQALVNVPSDFEQRDVPFDRPPMEFPSGNELEAWGIKKRIKSTGETVYQYNGQLYRINTVAGGRSQ